MIDSSSRPTEQRHPEAGSLSELSPEAFVELMVDENRRAVDRVQSASEEIATAIEWVADAIQNGGRLFYAGAGTSGRLGVLDASECPPTFSTDPETVQGIIAGGEEALANSVEEREDHPEHGASAMKERDVTGDDVVMGISAGGTTPFVKGALEAANERGARTIALICIPPEQSPLDADLIISVVTGPEILSGSTRLKAGTATKVVLNTITTGAMVRMGKTYENLMVDLQTSNQKLRDRAIRIVSSVTGLNEKKAKERLNEAEGRVKVAIIMEQKQVPCEEAVDLLKQNDGHLSLLLDNS